MRINYLIVFILLFLNLLINRPVFGALRLNEIYPAPSSGQEEWVELYNDEDKQIDISGYSLTDAANNKITLPATIGPLSFISATSSNVLNNSGDTLNLKNSLNEIIEIITYSGSFNNEKSYARCPDGNGSWSIVTTLTRNQPNPCPSSTPTLTPTYAIEPTPTIAQTIPTPELTSTPSATLIPTTSETIIPTSLPTTIPSPSLTLTPTFPLSPTPLTSYDNIYLSEAMVYPETGESEWVELFNNNDFSVELQNWFLDDISGSGSSPKSFSLNIQAKGYAVFSLSSAMFNNSGDTVRLLDFNHTIKDEFNYSDSKKGKTWGKININENTICLQEPSKGDNNHSCLLTNADEDENTTVTTIANQTLQPTIKSFTPQTQSSKRINIQKNLQLINTPQLSTKITQYETHNSQGLVLGASTLNKSINYSIIKSLSFSSFSFALLAFSSIIYKCFLKYCIMNLWTEF
ncbi:MAG: lamin tail domain-containing protein [Candidatus Roizmanbacteria bacterium]|nr:MAG: lamin tail domain-containing protein [Candidatus Roizmanbacteria bacterium]